MLVDYHVLQYSIITVLYCNNYSAFESRAFKQYLTHPLSVHLFGKAVEIPTFQLDEALKLPASKIKQKKRVQIITSVYMHAIVQLECIPYQTSVLYCTVWLTYLTKV